MRSIWCGSAPAPCSAARISTRRRISAPTSCAATGTALPIRTRSSSITTTPCCATFSSCQTATGRYRAPDPWYAVADEVMVRRLSPNNRKLDAETHPLELIDKRMLRLMAHDLASIHLGLKDARKTIEHDLRKRGATFLGDAV